MVDLPLSRSAPPTSDRSGWGEAEARVRGVGLIDVYAIARHEQERKGKPH